VYSCVEYASLDLQISIVCPSIDKTAPLYSVITTPYQLGSVTIIIYGIFFLDVAI